MEASGRDRQPRSWTARILAPLALLAVVAAAFLIVNSSMSDDEGPERRGGGGKRGQAAQSGECNPPADRALKVGYYILKPDEPGLSAVADRTCMTVAELSELNPDLDPQLISVGQCINLRKNGCDNRE